MKRGLKAADVPSDRYFMWVKGQTFEGKKSFELISLFPHGPISTGFLQPQEVLCINQS